MQEELTLTLSKTERSLYSTSEMLVLRLLVKTQQVKSHVEGTEGSPKEVLQAQGSSRV